MQDGDRCRVLKIPDTNEFITATATGGKKGVAVVTSNVRDLGGVTT